MVTAEERTVCADGVQIQLRQLETVLAEGCGQQITMFGRGLPA